VPEEGDVWFLETRESLQRDSNQREKNQRKGNFSTEKTLWQKRASRKVAF
jgi:hypothetical protein